MINKDILKHSIDIGLKKTDIAKIFNVGRILVARCVKFHGLTYVLRAPEDDEITQMLRDVHQFQPNVACFFAVIHLRTKEINVKQVRLSLMLKILNIHNPFQWM